MKVDIYNSQPKPSFALVVPTGVDPATITGSAAAGIAKLQPLTLNKNNVDLHTIAHGELLSFLTNQISTEGAGLIKTSISFSEIG
jgi:hypothetical protein